MSKFRILCKVSGGVTGDRRSYVKRSGIEVIYDNRAEAENDAAEFSTKMNSRHATATFTYTVKRYMSGKELLATHTYKGQEALDLD